MSLESWTQMLTLMAKFAYTVVEGRSCPSTLSLCRRMILRVASVVISLLHNAVSEPYDAVCKAWPSDCLCTAYREKKKKTGRNNTPWNANVVVGAKSSNIYVHPADQEISNFYGSQRFIKHAPRVNCEPFKGTPYFDTLLLYCTVPTPLRGVDQQLSVVWCSGHNWDLELE